MANISIPKGTRDFGPTIMGKRQFILNNIKSVYQQYGFLPLETPAMENLSVLTGKYGEEGDQLLFRILDSGDFFSDSAVEVGKSIHYLIKITKTLIIELLSDLKEDRYVNIEYLTKNEISDEIKLFNWILKYYRTVSMGRLSETLEFNIEHILNSENEYNSYIRKLTQLIIDAIRDRNLLYINYNDKNSLSNEIDYFIIVNYDKFYSFLNSINNLKQIRNLVAEKGLRYDLTVPFARYVVMNRHEITLPFKRYQIQPVWRADRPQKGRYREFYQCDADVVGTTSLLCEAEIICMIKTVMQRLGINDFTIKVNHRGVLAGLADLADSKGKEVALYTAIDKLDKIGEEKVKEELIGAGFTAKQSDNIFNLLNYKGTNQEKFQYLKQTFEHSTSGTKGINDLQQVFSILHSLQESDVQVEFDVALARGLSYYTGCIFEVKVNNVKIGSISGGGRYDNLTQSFDSKESLSGIGISFGVDRIFDVMEELNLFPKETTQSSKVLVAFLDEESMHYAYGIVANIRKHGVAAELYPDFVKIKKQLDYANKKQIPFAIIIGEEERKQNKLALKNLESGEQSIVDMAGLIQLFKHS